MELILKEDIDGLGYKDDIVTVKPGYGRNYLIPQGYAILATDSAKKVLAENIKQAQHKAEKVKQDALDKATLLETITLEIKTRASESGKIFGSITNTQLATALEGRGFEIDRRKISINQKEVKSLGEYSATINLHKEVKPQIRFAVITEEE